MNSSHKTFLFCIVVLSIFFFMIQKEIKKGKIKSKDFVKKKIKDIENELKTGDLVLFSDMKRKAQSVSVAVRYMTASMINHIGMIYRHPKTNHLYIFEMFFDGLRLSPFYTKFKHFIGKAYIRPLNQSLTEEQLKKLDEYLRSHWMDNYNYGFIIHGFNRAFPIPLPVPHLDLKREHTCCELVFQTLHEIGVFGGDEKQKINVQPRDFLTLTQRLPLEKGYEYYEEIEILV